MKWKVREDKSISVRIFLKEKLVILWIKTSWFTLNLHMGFWGFPVSYSIPSIIALTVI